MEQNINFETIQDNNTINTPLLEIKRKTFNKLEGIPETILYEGKIFIQNGHNLKVIQ